jgi:uncharacterized protein
MSLMDYQTTIETWRDDYCSKLLAPQGWLSIVGLVWLEEGTNLIGSGQECLFPLDTRVPERLAEFRLESGVVSFESEQDFIYQDQPTRTVRFEMFEDQNSAYLHFGDMAFSVLRRGEQYGLRIFDNKAESKRNFKGLTWFPVDPAYRVQATFNRYEQPKKLTISTVMGGRFEEMISGEVEFILHQNTYRLLPMESPEGFFFIFKDSTNADLSYPAGRFLYTDLPEDGVITLDFNKAHNPPCEYTLFATCPLPLKENYLEIPILAGEKRYKLGT